MFTTNLQPDTITNTKEKMAQKIAKIQSFCVSFNGWSSHVTRVSISLVVYGVSSSWNLDTFFLALHQVIKSETAKMIAGTAKEVC